MHHSRDWEVSGIASEFLADRRGPRVEVRRLGLVHLVYVRSAVVCVTHGVSSVASAEGLIKASRSAKHSTQLVSLALLPSGRGPRIGVGVHLAAERGDPSVHGCTTGRTVGILAMELDARGTTAITGRSHGCGSLQIVEQTLNLSNVNFLGSLGPADHFGRVYLGSLGAAIGLVPCAVRLSRQHSVLGAVVLVVVDRAG